MDLQKGQKIKISDLTSSPLLELSVSVSMKTGAADVTCFGVNEQNQLSDDRYFVFYNQTSSPEGAISMNASPGSTRFAIDLKRLPPFLKKLVVTIAADGGAMQDIMKGRLSLSADQKSLAEFHFSGKDFSQEKALILCELYEKGGVWRLSAVASGFNGGLSALLAHFGGVEAPPAAPAPMPKTAPPLAPPPPAPTEPAVPKKINLSKSGDSHKINLSKNSGEIHVNLNWNTGKKKGLFSRGDSVDLDLACMFRLKTGEMGVIQALGNSFGSAFQPPFILLDKDDRTGSSQDGENMWFKKPDLVDFAIIFAFIYEGVPNWNKTDAAVVLKQSGSPDIEIHIQNSNSRDRFCVIASLTGSSGHLEVKREERFFPGHQEIDHFYRFGFRWKPGRK